MKYWLLDTGPLVAYLNRADPAHSKVAACLDCFTGQLASTSAVITEAMHFVSSDSRGPRWCAEFVDASHLPCSTPAEHSDIPVTAQGVRDSIAWA